MENLPTEKKNSSIEEKRASIPKCVQDEIKQVMGTKEYALAQDMLFTATLALEPVALVDPDSKFTEIPQQILRAVGDFKPKDAVETRLVSQAIVAYEHAMSLVRRGSSADMLCHLEAYTNLGIKFMRVHNETIEALNRYRRGGEQKVTVTHIAEKMAVVNNYGSGGKNQGGTSCSSKSAEPSLKETTINHADSQQWPTEGADCMAVKAQELKRQKDASAAE